MKRVFVSIAALGVLLSLFACGGNGSALVGTWEHTGGQSIVFHADGYVEMHDAYSSELFQWRVSGSTLFIRRGVWQQALDLFGDSGEEGQIVWDAEEEEVAFRMRGDQLVLVHENDGRIELVRRD